MTAWIVVGGTLATGSFAWWRCTLHRPPRSARERGVL